MREAKGLDKERRDRSPEILGAGMPFPSYLPAGIHQLMCGNPSATNPGSLMAVKLKGLSFTDLSSGFAPPVYLPALANTYYTYSVELNLLCSKPILDSHQRFSCEILYLVLCTDHSKIFFFGSKHSLELMTTITFLTFS